MNFQDFHDFQDFSSFSEFLMVVLWSVCQDCVKCMFFSSFFQVLPFVTVFRSSAVNFDFFLTFVSSGYV